jgi:hypothetical protein
MTYSTEQVATAKDRVCKEIADGKSLRAICAAEDMPSVETVRVWLIEDHEFSVQYARAREEQADYYADEIIDIADAAKDANLARLQIDARKWKASKLQPKKYGDKIDLNHSGAIEHLTDEQLESKLAILLGKAGAGVLAGGSREAEGEA